MASGSTAYNPENMPLSNFPVFDGTKSDRLVRESAPNDAQKKGGGKKTKQKGVKMAKKKAGDKSQTASTKPTDTGKRHVSSRHHHEAAAKAFTDYRSPNVSCYEWDAAQSSRLEIARQPR
jgi:hypothetical protein